MSQTGITYYKLESFYPGDVTKGCGLTGSEIDKNFHFLRGYDIKNAKIDEEAGTIILERINCEDIVIEGLKDYIKEVAHVEEFSLSGSTYDAENGILHLVLNEEDYPVEGFYTHVIGGDGIKGSGTYGNPLKVDGLLLTGFFSPVKKFYNFENQAEKNSFFSLKGEQGDRYLTREFISPYGLLYNFNGVKKIEDILNNEHRGWRIPTIEDWDNLLNATECIEYRNHNRHISAIENGNMAGYILKDEIWDEIKIGKQGFKILPTEYNENYIPCAIFWTNSEDEGTKEYNAKQFTKGKGTVQHRFESKNNFHSIRLVRNLDTPFEPVENIGGILYNCVSAKTIDTSGNIIALSWTVENVSFDLGQDSRLPYIYENGEYKFFLNGWNNELSNWDKRAFIEHSIVTIKEFSGYTEPEEFILKDGVLEPYFNIVYGKIKEYVDAKVAIEAEERISADDALNSKIEGEIAQRIAESKDLSERLMTESAERQAEDSSLSQRIATESAERQAVDNTLSQRIVDEAVERANQDGLLSQRIINEATERINHDIQVKQYNATVNGVTLNTNDGTEIKVTFDGSFGKVDFYNE